MVAALKNYKKLDFNQPTGLKKVKIVKHNGLLDCGDREETQDIYYEYFKITTVPTACDEGNVISSDKEEIPEELIENEQLDEKNFEL